MVGSRIPKAKRGNTIMKKILPLVALVLVAACQKAETEAAPEATEANVTVQEPEAAVTTEVEVTDPAAK